MSIRIRRAASLTVGRDNLVAILESLLDPLVLLLSTWAIALYAEGELRPPYLILSLILFSITFPGTSMLRLPFWKVVRNTLLGWSAIALLLLFFAHASQYLRLFDPRAVMLWLWATPLALLAAHLLFRVAVPRLRNAHRQVRTAVIAGLNDPGLALARRMDSSPYVALRLAGYFDDRSQERLADMPAAPLLGRLDDLPAYVKEHRVDSIYLSLPMASQPRILDLLEALRDTTASVYFVPDTFMTDLVQGRVDLVEDIPVVAVCDTPFKGARGLAKTLSDLSIALLILIVILPLLLIVALGVKLSSPGPVIFRQRRYGLNGEEIYVYKFRSMTVCEDAGPIRQASRGDQRVTRFGAFLRKTSLDELPQFINVLQGRMSIVGPRPHAVAHNEQYRRLIRGYMVRHKVKPGITGWAQVNGYRGETETVDKMQKRIDYDLDYLRNWSLRLDLFIILKTLLVVFKRENAY